MCCVIPVVNAAFSRQTETVDQFGSLCFLVDFLLSEFLPQLT